MARKKKRNIPLKAPRRIPRDARPVARSTDGVIIGHVFERNGRLVFFQNKIGYLHRLQTPPAWCLDRWAADALEALGVTEMVIFDRETGVEWQRTLEDVSRMRVIDRGHGEQYLLMLNTWTRDGVPPAPKPQKKAAAEPDQPAAEQLSLF